MRFTALKSLVCYAMFMQIIVYLATRTNADGAREREAHEEAEEGAAYHVPHSIRDVVGRSLKRDKKRRQV